jgi:hypothetical protein
MANQWYKRGITLKDRLDQLYQKYGYYTMTPSYFFCYSPEKITAIFSMSSHQIIALLLPFTYHVFIG